MSDAEARDWKYLCRDCQTETDPTTGETYRVDKVREPISTRATAETLASIHRTLNGGHDPEVMPVD